MNSGRRGLRFLQGRSHKLVSRSTCPKVFLLTKWLKLDKHTEGERARIRSGIWRHLYPLRWLLHTAFLCHTPLLPAVRTPTPRRSLRETIGARVPVQEAAAPRSLDWVPSETSQFWTWFRFRITNRRKKRQLWTFLSSNESAEAERAQLTLSDRGSIVLIGEEYRTEAGLDQDGGSRVFRTGLILLRTETPSPAAAAPAAVSLRSWRR